MCYSFLDEKFVAMVYSTKAHANILRVDVTAALSMEGVIGFVDHRDIPGSNFYHENKSDEIFATEKVIQPRFLLLCAFS